MKKRLSILLTVLMITLLAASCAAPSQPATQTAVAATAAPAPAATQEPASGSTSAQNAKQLVFGLSSPQLDATGFKVNADAVQKYCDDNGIKLITLDASNDVDKQLKQIEDFITQGVNAIIFTPVDSAALAKGVEKANAANIPIVAMDRSVEGGKLTGMVESDNTAHGAEAAVLMAQAAKDAGIDVKDLKVLELLGAQATSAGLERHDGFSKKAAELGINIVSSLPTEWQSDKAYNAVLDAFQAHPDINAIFEASDIAMHGGVEPALKQLGKLVAAGTQGHIMITSVDGGPQGLDAIRNGYIDGIASQSLIEMGSKAAEIAMQAANGGMNGKDTVTVKLNPVAAQKSNVDSAELWANQK